MRLPQPFYRLPLRFDAERLLAEVRALPQAAWAKHPNEIAGNSSVRLISVEGGENDSINGEMRLTPHLRQSPYIRQILARFGVVWSRSRLMRLAPGAEVPQHADINYHWFNRVRLHIPVITTPEVKFYCDEECVHMAAGEAWLFDNWRRHRVINPAPHERIHLVADTSGSAAFWRFVYASRNAGAPDERCEFDPKSDPTPLTERTVLAPVMHPSELELLVIDLRAELAAETREAATRIPSFHAMLEAFCRDWRQLYLLHGAEAGGWSEFTKLRDSVRAMSRELSEGLVMRTNGVAAHSVLEGRVLRVAVSPLPANSIVAPSTAKATAPAIDRPVFIVAAPRSGSTLLFETLSVASGLFTLGGEAHLLIEGIGALRPGAPGVDSNRLTQEHCTPEIAAKIRAEIGADARDSVGNRASGVLRLLEKTPKNSLRIPFLDKIFPDALFIFLWRDPRANLSSIIEAWRSGNWKTYNGLRGFDGPWSLLLPPGWQSMNGKPLEEIAALQWESANRIVLDDLNALSRQRWTAVNYDDFLDDPTRTIQQLCEFIGVEFDSALRDRVSGPLPLSRQTQTAPSADKWRRNETEIARVLPSVQATWNRLKDL